MLRGKFTTSSSVTGRSNTINTSYSQASNSFLNFMDANAVERSLPLHPSSSSSLSALCLSPPKSCLLVFLRLSRGRECVSVSVAMPVEPGGLRGLGARA